MASADLVPRAANHTAARLGQRAPRAIDSWFVEERSLHRRQCLAAFAFRFRFWNSARQLLAGSSDIFTVDPPDQPLLVEAGEVLFGSQWRAGLMRELEISQRQLDGLLADEEGVPAVVWRRILEGLARHRMRENRMEILC